MKRLIIIGNGFDIAHSLPTTFWNFIDSNIDFKDKYSEFSGKDWNEVESTYAELLCEIANNREYVDIEDVIHKQLEDVFNEEYGIIESDRVVINEFEQELSILGSYVDLLSEFERDFKEYLNNVCNIDTIKNIKQRTRIKNLLNTADWIISFNYTDVVEDTYHVSNVTHIHGSLKDDNISIGSSSLMNLLEEKLNTEDPSEMKCRDKYDFQEKMEYYEEDMEGHLHKKSDLYDLYTSIKDELENKEDFLYQLINEKNKDSLASRSEVKKMLNELYFDEVIILGHSLGVADLPVFDSINKDALFTCYYYSDDEHPNMEGSLKDLKVKFKLIKCDDLYY